MSQWKHGHPYRLRADGRRVSDWITQRYPERISRISFIKIDTEGAELSVLQSMEAILRRQQPTLHLEMHRHAEGPQRQEFLEFLSDLGYEMRRTHGPYDLEAGESITARNSMAWPHYDFLAVHPDRQSRLGLRRAA